MAIAKVQSFSAIMGSSTNTLTSGSFTALTTGNILVVGASVNANLMIITQNSGTIEWEYLTSVLTGGVVGLQLCIGRIISGGATTVTLNATSTGAIALAGIEFSGFTRARLDKTSRNSGTTSPASSGALATTTTATELWIGAVAARNDTFSSQTINTVAVDFDINAATTFFATTGNRSVDLFYRIVSGTGTPNCSVTLGATTQWQGLLAALEETPAGGGGGAVAHTFA